MKSVLISIQPKWCELIASGKKTVEIRKTKPKLEPPFKAYIYCTIGDGAKGDILPQSRVTCGKVIGEFVCDDITKILNFITHFGVEGRSECELNTIARCSCLDYIAMLGYLGTDKDGYAWHISDLVIYDHPKELSEFRSYDARAYIGENGYLMPTHEITRPPQSWCYVEGGRLSNHTYDLLTMEKVVTDYLDETYREGKEEGYSNENQMPGYGRYAVEE